MNPKGLHYAVKDTLTDT